MPNCALGGVISTYTHDPAHESQFLRCFAICIILFNSVLRSCLLQNHLRFSCKVEEKHLGCSPFARLNVTLGHQRINKTVERLQHDHASKVWKWNTEPGSRDWPILSTVKKMPFFIRNPKEGKLTISKIL